MPSIVEKGIVLVVVDDGEHDDPLQDVCGLGMHGDEQQRLLVTVLTGWTHGPLGLRDAGWVKVGREVPGAFNLYR